MNKYDDVVALEQEAQDKSMMGHDLYNRLREISALVKAKALYTNDELYDYLKIKLQTILKDTTLSIKLQTMFTKCMLNTITTTLIRHDEEYSFIITGDLPAMWLRDSAGQLKVFLNILEPGDILDLEVSKVIKQQFKLINNDPYANAFNIEPSGYCWSSLDKSERDNPSAWERKFELDSLCFPVELLYLYYKKTNNDAIFTKEIYNGLKTIIDVMKIEQNHAEQSNYFFVRDNNIPDDTIPNQGRGNPCGYTGMIWSGFRPSDDSCYYNYLIPSNMFAHVILGYIIEINDLIFKDDLLKEDCITIQKAIKKGIDTYGIIDHPQYNKIYAFEVDGLGNYSLMDDAGIPSLVGIPYINYQVDEVYHNTRAYCLSTANPYYFKGQLAQGMGSSHTPPDYIWHIGLAVEGLTTTDEADMKRILSLFEISDANTNLTHEGFHMDNPQIYTRDWFSWSNSVFCELYLKAHNLKIHM